MKKDEYKEGKLQIQYTLKRNSWEKPPYILEIQLEGKYGLWGFWSTEHKKETAVIEVDGCESIQLTSPTSGFYFFGRKIFPFNTNRAVVYGNVEVKARLNELWKINNKLGIGRVDFIVDGKIEDSLTGISKEELYYFDWNPKAGRYEIAVRAWQYPERSGYSTLDEISVNIL